MWKPDRGFYHPGGVLLKMGSYGILRFCQPLFPQACLQFQPMITLVCLIGVLYGAAMVLVQTDFKRMVAYRRCPTWASAFWGFSASTSMAAGGMLTMINHGISTGALFLIVGMFYERTHTRDLSKYGGRSPRCR